MTNPETTISLRVAGGFAVVFGALTIVSSGRALFGNADMGAVVPFVLWFNFLAGFAYVIAGIGLWRGRRWAVRLSLLVFLATAIVFALFGLHVLRGGVYEARTVGAMTLRCTVWAIIAWVAARHRPTDPA
ncbi:hypothetical protein [Ruegeria marina]|uniref:Uncharacterized protein n=1 Tax=Ruegeria marina TaxID=639004 RepID=A0A1G7DZE5_9RHOB|nr:hypothetical protein [Ruegeria marina]SDE56784.1 hypothetical protein SAMN04488239_12312 [Ruegeria marina]